MKKRELVLGAIALTGSVAGMVSTEAAYAALTCTSASTVAAQLICSGTTASSFLAQPLNFSGSNGVQMGVSDSTAVLGLCGSNIQGVSRYGMSTSSTVMTSATGTATTSNSGGCA